MMVLDIHARFHEALTTGEPTGVQLLVDTTNSPQGLSAASYAARIVGRFSQEMIMTRNGQRGSSSMTVPMILSDHRVWFNQGEKRRVMNAASMRRGIFFSGGAWRWALLSRCGP